jgi:hypothetical protein
MRPVGIVAGVAAVVLAALFLSLTLAYAAACAVVMRNGYGAMALRGEIEDLRAEAALLRYQINHAQSRAKLEQEAARLGMRPADTTQEIDYVVLPYSERDAEVQVAERERSRDASGLAATLADLATEVVSVGGRAEASTGEGDRP